MSHNCFQFSQCSGTRVFYFFLFLLLFLTARRHSFREIQLVQRQVVLSNRFVKRESGQSRGFKSTQMFSIALGNFYSCFEAAIATTIEAFIHTAVTGSVVPWQFSFLLFWKRVGLVIGVTFHQTIGEIQHMTGTIDLSCKMIVCKGGFSGSGETTQVMAFFIVTDVCKVFTGF